ncbi:MAG: hypothetical protein NT150_00055, partial [Bacteroidetes bacterium]|nr:hypothetical protein [Bacteroidota bacterium]
MLNPVVGSEPTYNFTDDFTHQNEVNFANKTTRNVVVKLSYTRDEHTDLITAGLWQYKIIYSVDNVPGVDHELELSFNKGELKSVYQAVNKHAITSTNTSDNYYFNIKIKKVLCKLNNSGTWLPVTKNYFITSLPKDIELEYGLEVEQFLDLDNTVHKLKYENELISWDASRGAEEYDLEWVWLDSEDKGFVFDAKNPSAVFKYKEPTRVRIKSTNYRIDQTTYAKGKLYFRMRAVGRYLDNTEKIRNSYWDYKSVVTLQKSYDDVLLEYMNSVQQKFINNSGYPTTPTSPVNLRDDFNDFGMRWMIGDPNVPAESEREVVEAYYKSQSGSYQFFASSFVCHNCNPSNPSNPLVDFNHDMPILIKTIDNSSLYAHVVFNASEWRSIKTIYSNIFVVSYGWYNGTVRSYNYRKADVELMDGSIITGYVLAGPTHEMQGTLYAYNPQLVVDILPASDKNLNWSYASTYAEDGKYKAVMSYYDGGLKSRQSLTNLSSSDFTIVAESFYNFEGVQSASVLPAPISGRNLAYQGKINKESLSGEDFSAKHFDQGTVKQLSTTTGAAKYFSPNNSFVDDPFSSRIPDMEGYAYTQITYMSDGTGRISAQSGIGNEHKIGSGHETKYAYSTPSSTELQMLFGNNVGNASHYKKNMVVDANGQVSISYLDQEGRTIATALAGEGPATLDKLTEPDYLSANNTSTEIEVSLDSNNVVDQERLETRVSHGIANVVPNTIYTFTYDMSAVKNYNETKKIEYTVDENGDQIATEVTEAHCTSCKYELSLFIEDAKGVRVPLTVTSTLSGNSADVPAGPITLYTEKIGAGAVDCSADGTEPTAGKLNFTANLPDVGNYQLVKVFKVAYDMEEDIVAMAQSAGVSSTYLADLTTAKKANINCSLCNTACEDKCVAKAVEKLLENTALTASQRSKLNDYRCKTATELTAIHDGTDLTILASDIPAGLWDQFQTNISTDCSLSSPAVANMISGGLDHECDAKLMQLKSDVSPNGWEYASSATSEFWTGVASLSLPNYAGSHTKAEVLSHWPQVQADADAWIDVLVTKHREYCHYTACANNIAGDAFTMGLSSVKTWDEALTTGVLMPVRASLLGSFFVLFYNANTQSEASIAAGSIVIGSKDPLKDDQNFIAKLKAYTGKTPPSNPLDQTGSTAVEKTGIWEYAYHFYDAAYDASNIGVTNANRSQNRWSLFVGTYNTIRRAHLDGLITSCPYYTDDKAVYTNMSTDKSLVKDNAQNQVANFAGRYSSTQKDECDLKVNEWLNRLTEGCSTVTDNQKVPLKNYLSNFCNVSTVYADPLHVITQEDVTALANAKASNTTFNQTTNPRLFYLQQADNYITNNSEFCHPLSILVTVGLAYEYATENGSTDFVIIEKDEKSLQILKVISDNLLPNPVHINNVEKVISLDGVEGYSGKYAFIQAESGEVFIGTAAPYDVCAFGQFQNNYGNAFLFSIKGAHSPYQTLTALTLPSSIDYSSLEPNLIPLIMTTDNSIYSPNGMFKLYDESEFGSWIHYHCPNVGNCYQASTQSVQGCGDLAYKEVTTKVVKSITSSPFSLPNDLLGLEKKQCLDGLEQEAEYQAQTEYNKVLEDFMSTSLINIHKKCLNNLLEESFSYTYNSREYHYTLYYYDQAGNLVQTVPPAGVDKLSAAFVKATVAAAGNAGKFPADGSANPKHRLLTNYKYNSLNQLVYQRTPDGGESFFYYDYAGRLRFSENAKQ